MAGGARIKDALVAAGGLGVNADRVYVSKNINLAVPLRDGVKIYIPAVGETETQNAAPVTNDFPLDPAHVESSALYKEGKININTAGARELETLKGIGPVRAGEIIANRPYERIEELREKGVLGEKTFEAIRDRITVY